ncbi:hypothetical protein SYNPS1DRAFT_21999 [Syncephalis pseudoplumigaleata]|uniref:Polynucleotide 5'-hydroxyl-kinase GRC3 n=1 Tax=Syncephalis pseudoplumigaleata TaxID=1712513 RepID=A0A4P9Z126_9FUNG|nr:hypothetical protein SYNPS1DRAFT_21999 [Syncephalis pseudoplumigaleata]|eukprot:RKP26183.1 hypothetical protein SYNPS1DRAFT_21999 [Syncephalis pseudoplumigaleata]
MYLPYSSTVLAAAAVAVLLCSADALSIAGPKVRRDSSDDDVGAAFGAGDGGSSSNVILLPPDVLNESDTEVNSLNIRRKLETGEEGAELEDDIGSFNLAAAQCNSYDNCIICIRCFSVTVAYIAYKPVGQGTHRACYSACGVDKACCDDAFLKCGRETCTNIMNATTSFSSCENDWTWTGKYPRELRLMHATEFGCPTFHQAQVQCRLKDSGFLGCVPSRDWGRPKPANSTTHATNGTSTNAQQPARKLAARALPAAATAASPKPTPTPTKQATPPPPPPPPAKATKAAAAAADAQRPASPAKKDTIALNLGAATHKLADATGTPVVAVDAGIGLPPTTPPKNTPSSATSATTRQIRLAPENELRLEVEFGYHLTLKMTEGMAEIFGCELMLEKEYRFSGQKLAVFTWQGCTIELSGADYVADDTPMPIFLNIHASLEERRAAAALQNTRGPRVVLVGAPDSGKTSLAKLLLNYAVRQGRQPMFVSLDTADGGAVMPGAISTAMVDLPVYPEEELGSIGLDLIASGGSRTPVAYYYGYDSPRENPKLLHKLIGKMAETVDARLQEDQEADIVLVLGHERLHSDLTRSLAGTSHVTILKLTKLGGVARRDKPFLRQSQMRRIREYFYGHPGQCELSPFSLVISFNDVKIYRVREAVLCRHYW